jgi:hypothetical protein
MQGLCNRQLVSTRSGLRGHFVVGSGFDALNCSVILCKLSTLFVDSQGKVTSQAHQMQSDKKENSTTSTEYNSISVL